MHKLHLHIVISRAWLPQPPKGVDLNLIDDYFISQGYSSKKLQKFNRCRVFLQLLSLSDMVSANGRHIIPSVLQGTQLANRHSTLEWPMQRRPPQSDWVLWEVAFASLCKNYAPLKWPGVSCIKNCFGTWTLVTTCIKSQWAIAGLCMLHCQSGTNGL
jgi:hypothetical protein